MRPRPLTAVTAPACLTVLALATAAPAAATSTHEAGPPPVDVQLLAFNDFHGALQPPSGSGGRVTLADGSTVDAGGLASFATHLRQLEAETPNSLTVSNGDMIGGSPFLSALFRDEPTVDAMDALGLDVATVGNHEFDEGVDELLRIVEGGACHPEDGCLDGDGYDGSDATWLAANVVVRDTGEPILPPYVVHEFDGVQVGVIGLTLDETPSIVSAEGIADNEFLDEVATINRYTAELQADGVEAVVVSLHEGGEAGGGPNACEEPTGPAFEIAERVTDAVDVVLTGHYHNGYVCQGEDEVDGKLVTQALSNGRLITDVDLSIDRRTGDVVAKAAENVVVSRDVAPDAEAQALVDRYAALAEPIANEPVGAVTADVLRAQEPLVGDLGGESPLGNLIADAQLAATDEEAGAVAAFMNPGGVRADLTLASSDAGEGEGVVTYGEAFEVQPFNNLLTTLDLTGAQLYALLDQQFAVGRVLAPSDSVRYTVAADGSAVVPGSLTIGGTVVDTAATYRITVNNFLAGGGDGFTVLTEGTNAVNQPGFDVDALIAYLSGDPVAPPATDRITVAG
ncbi:bifunctional UDP-sugar hydrolase/5'-nucleotidase [Geodermatophilus sp. DSM 44513]|uniref:bifunctional metallophosphatase/5'-nucleotidase n=1 Tax=Geodermatophilus sp. DSM 44513 TaxID=1528104 RepID=UPI0012800132|nr:bifunctional metallophosphatase/5'-nucleotidase [Geodermatophilus sp. DSM 44513]WNV77125.1 bifunctional metallophosphatase/5'-nucleotidase [Geodermatophilus sp. DSM 44513]